MQALFGKKKNETGANPSEPAVGPLTSLQPAKIPQPASLSQPAEQLQQLVEAKQSVSQALQSTQ